MSVIPISTVRPIESSKSDDLFIASVSFEPRCLNVSARLKKSEYKARNMLLVRYYGEDNLKNKHQLRLKEILKPYLESPSHEIEPVYFNKYDSSKFTRFLHDLAHKNPSLERITVDISTFTKQYLLLLLRFLRSNYPNAKIRLLYTPGYYMVRQNLTWGIKDITYLPYFGNLDCVELHRNILILLLGYEGERAYAIWKYVEPDLTVAVIGNPPTYHGADLPSRSANRSILEHPNTVVEEVSALDPACTKDLLNRWYRDEKYKDSMVSIAPLGTKMQTVGIYLFFEENNNASRAQIVYAFPLFYNKEKYTLEFDKEIREFYLPHKNNEKVKSVESESQRK
ncbi:hypothetical protein ISS37_10250 [candidate division KSB1 bacterium]|nr:hypothetical protein [candidate division KSB1 bacterium]